MNKIKIDFFKSQLKVNFTLNELYQLSSALATESFSESDAGNSYNAQSAWDLRSKVISFIDIYKSLL